LGKPHFCVRILGKRQADKRMASLHKALAFTSGALITAKNDPFCLKSLELELHSLSLMYVCTSEFDLLLKK